MFSGKIVKEKHKKAVPLLLFHVREKIKGFCTVQYVLNAKQVLFAFSRKIFQSKVEKPNHRKSGRKLLQVINMCFYI